MAIINERVRRVHPYSRYHAVNIPIYLNMEFIFCIILCKLWVYIIDGSCGVLCMFVVNISIIL